MRIVEAKKSYSRLLSLRITPVFNIISLYSRSFVNSARSIISEFLFIQLVICAIAMAFNLFALESHGIFSTHSMSTIIGLIVVLTFTFIVCYLAEALTLDLNGIADIFYDLAWYQLPIKAQTLFIPIISHSLHEFRLNGIGLIECSLFVFGKVSMTESLKTWDDVFDRIKHLFVIVVSDTSKCSLVFLVYS